MLISIFLPIFSLISLVISQPPYYSSSYAKVLRQPREKLNLDRTSKEDVTENPYAEPDLVPLDVTTEPESEQINFARFTNKISNKDKIVEQIQASREEKTESLELIDDLNEQGTYYIIHPSGLFQKVVYKSLDDLENMQFSTQVKYENVEPIVEPIYTYDPKTFLFQRLIFA